MKANTYTPQSNELKIVRLLSMNVIIMRKCSPYLGCRGTEMLVIFNLIPVELQQRGKNLEAILKPASKLISKKSKKFSPSAIKYNNDNI